MVNSKYQSHNHETLCFHPSELKNDDPLNVDSQSFLRHGKAGPVQGGGAAGLDPQFLRTAMGDGFLSLLLPSGELT